MTPAAFLADTQSSRNGAAASMNDELHEITLTQYVQLLADAHRDAMVSLSNLASA
ncbi:hypothetical protein [Streptomyces sp. NPDC002491]